MKVIVCVDDKNGMMFNHRRQSQDRILREYILKMTAGVPLWMNTFSRKQFVEDGGNIVTDEAFLEKAKQGDYCFVENQEIQPYEDKIENIILCKWNRRYPADQYLLFDFHGWEVAETEEIVGSSHEKITMENYIRCER